MIPKENLNYLDFDIYSRRISFYYKSKEKFGSLFGFLLTIFYAVISIIIFMVHFLKTIKRSEVRVTDFTLYPSDFLSINLNKNLFYIVFGLENSAKLTGYIDESIYYPEAVFIEEVRENGEYVSKTEIVLNIEKCNKMSFDEEFQKLFEKTDYKEFYCLKDLNLTLKSGYKYNKISYIKINIYPCSNNTNNNNHCKPKNIIDNYLSSSYFFVLSKDIGFNPFNYTYPIVPYTQYLSTSLVNSIFKEYFIYYGITQIDTDTGLFGNYIKRDIYLKYIQNYYSLFVINDEKNKTEKIFTAQIRLEDYIYYQKRTFTKMSEVFSTTGGYMQLISTIFALVTLFTKKFSLEKKLLNNLFSFNIKQRKIILNIEYKKKLTIM